MPDDSTGHRSIKGLQGLVASRADEQALLDALEKAFDYRGDITITLAGGEKAAGYLFDRRSAPTLAQSTLRLLAPGSQAPRTIRYCEIESIEFTGKDPAHGKSFETWVKKYTQKKLAGEEASIYSDHDDDNG